MTPTATASGDPGDLLHHVLQRLESLEKANHALQQRVAAAEGPRGSRVFVADLSGGSNRGFYEMAVKAPADNFTGSPTNTALVRMPGGRQSTSNLPLSLYTMRAFYDSGSTPSCTAVAMLETRTGAGTAYVQLTDPNWWGYIDSVAQDGANKRWQYTWHDPFKTAAGFSGWSNVVGRRFGPLFTYGAAYNTMEASNGSSGTYGNGWSSTKIASLNTATGLTWDIRAIPAGTVVRMHLVYAVDATTHQPLNVIPEPWFTIPNPVTP